MDLSILNAETQPIPLHAYIAFLAIIIGGIQLTLPKGTKVHKYIGYCWIILILIVSISSFWIHTIKTISIFSPIHLLSVYTIFSVFHAIHLARRGDIKRHQQTMKLIYVLALIITGFFTLLPGRTMNAVFFSSF
jgi:uncharacterized membrane protein